MTPIKTAICFFGITRSLRHTIGPIERRLLGPAASLGPTAIFSHFFELTDIANVRSGEFGTLDPEEHRLLDHHWLSLEPPERCLDAYDLETLKRYGDPWDDDFRSLRNLIHQLHSIARVTEAALDWAPDLVLFARPDLRYHESLARPLREMADLVTAPAATGDAAAAPAVAMVPDWQGWRGGANDRFAICTPAAARVYGSRVDHILEYCAEKQRPLHAELLLKYCLVQAGVEIRTMPMIASRVRFDGRRQKEDFVEDELAVFRRAWYALRALA